MTLPSAPSPYDLHDIQGNVLRGYRAGLARHLALAVGDAEAASRFLLALVDGDGGRVPRLTTAADWAARPRYFLNVALTADGLAALALPDAVLATFPEAFRQGPAFRDPAAGIDKPAAMGDTEASDPSQWIVGRPGGDPVHLVVSLYTGYRDESHGHHMAEVSAALREALARFALTETSCHEAEALPHGTVHFGYRDGIAQPRIAGAPGKFRHDMQPDTPAGDFLLGRDYVNSFAGNYLGDMPAALGDNGTYGAFRRLRQDVRAFEEFITRAGRRHNMDRELVAAKLMGRWRNGKPLVLAPLDPATPISDAHIDDFDYAPTADHPTYYDDAAGLRCPVGAHARRLNPRGALAMGKPHSRRVIRRGMPYGPAFDPAQPDDGVERGLVGFFLCGDLEGQFEFAQGTWANRDFATSGLRGTRDPIIGAQPEHGGRFTIRTADGRDPIVLDDLPRLTTTRGALYGFIPGLGALRWLGERRWLDAAAPQPMGYPSVAERLQEAPGAAGEPSVPPAGPPSVPQPTPPAAPPAP